jgi:hypothetical protein
VVSFVGAGTCNIEATVGATATYAQAIPVTQSFTVAPAPQTVSFQTVAPGAPIIGGTYTPMASSSSGLAVTLSLDSTSATGACTMISGVVSFTGVGLCVVDADQSGSVNYYAAPTAQQEFSVGLDTQTITFTSTAPTTVTLGQSFTYQILATASSSLPVLFSIDRTAAAVCAVDSSGNVTLLGAGNCIIDAAQAGNATTAPANSAQSFAVVAPTPVIPVVELEAPSAPSSLTISLAADNQASDTTTSVPNATITWASNPDTYSYQVSVVAPDGTQQSCLAYQYLNQTSCSFTNLEPSTTYNVQIIATNAGGASTPSTGSFTTAAMVAPLTTPTTHGYAVAGKASFILLAGSGFSNAAKVTTSLRGAKVSIISTSSGALRVMVKSAATTKPGRYTITISQNGKSVSTTYIVKQ